MNRDIDFSPIGYASMFSRLTNGEKLSVLRSFLHNFCQRPFAKDYHKMNDKQVYNSVFGEMISYRKYVYDKSGRESDKHYAEWFDLFVYHGPIYRVLLPVTCGLPDGRSYKRYPRENNIKWHNLTESWTKSLESLVASTSNIYPDTKVTIIKMDIPESDFGIDVNKLRDVLSLPNEYLEDEQEVIFPMDKKFVVDICSKTTIREYLEKEKREQKDGEVR